MYPERDFFCLAARNSPLRALEKTQDILIESYFYGNGLRRWVLKEEPASLKYFVAAFRWCLSAFTLQTHLLQNWLCKISCVANLHCFTEVSITVFFYSLHYWVSVFWNSAQNFNCQGKFLLVYSVDYYFSQLNTEIKCYGSVILIVLSDVFIFEAF